MMENLWPTPQQTQWRPIDQVPTAVNVIRETWFVQGFQSGDIRMTSSTSCQSRMHVFFLILLAVDNFGRMERGSSTTPTTPTASKVNIKIFRGHKGMAQKSITE